MDEDDDDEELLPPLDPPLPASAAGRKRTPVASTQSVKACPVSLINPSRRSPRAEVDGAEVEATVWSKPEG